MDEEKLSFLRKLRQIEEHARALTHELAPGPLQNQARLIWGLASHLVVHDDGVIPAPHRPRS